MNGTLRTRMHIAEAIRLHRVGFILAFVLTFFFTYGFLHSIDLVPERFPEQEAIAFTATSVASVETDASTDSMLDDQPVRIVADAIKLDAPIENPERRDIAVLDAALRRGVVHYPGSGNLEDHSNLLLFGHSSFLPTVHNESYRLFNNISKLSRGDIIRVQAKGYEYRYVVSSIELVDADDALVELSTREKKLTLSTCNSFGSKTERFVVEADYVGRVEINSDELSA